MQVILAAGGSGGHIFPSAALAAELEKEPGCDISFVSSRRRLDRNILKGTAHPCFFLSANPMPRGAHPVKWAVFAAKLTADVTAAVFIVLRVRPDVVVGFGGYSSGAIVLAAKLLGVRIIVHEQNFFPGRANRMLGRIADRIAVSFEGSARYFGRYAGKTACTGNPLRPGILNGERRAAAERLGISPDTPTVLIMGGSQGSSFLNTTAAEAARIVHEKLDGKVQFVHLTGIKDHGKVTDFYGGNGIAGRVISFLERIDDAYAASDLAISRAGAAAVFELAFYARPMILVPYPNPRNNQRSNAEYFAEAGAAVYREEKDLSADGLAAEVLRVLTDSRRRDNISRAARGLSVPDASGRLAEEVVALAGRHR